MLGALVLSTLFWVTVSTAANTDYHPPKLAVSTANGRSGSREIGELVLVRPFLTSTLSLLGVVLVRKAQVRTRVDLSCLRPQEEALRRRVAGRSRRFLRKVSKVLKSVVKLGIGFRLRRKQGVKWLSRPGIRLKQRRSRYNRGLALSTGRELKVWYSTFVQELLLSVLASYAALWASLYPICRIG